MYATPGEGNYIALAGRYIMKMSVTPYGSRVNIWPELSVPTCEICSLRSIILCLDGNGY